MTTELLETRIMTPCPWCKYLPRLQRLSLTKLYVCRCLNPSCAVGPSTNGHVNVDHAVEAWESQNNASAVAADADRSNPGGVAEAHA